MNDKIRSTAWCHVMRDGIVVFTDDNHLTATFSRLMATVFGERIERAGREREVALTCRCSVRGGWVAASHWCIVNVQCPTVLSEVRHRSFPARDPLWSRSSR
jgi:hypothetical protein